MLPPPSAQPAERAPHADRPVTGERLIVFDLELSESSIPNRPMTIRDIGAVDEIGNTFRSGNLPAFHRWVTNPGMHWAAGHNVVAFDLQKRPDVFPEAMGRIEVIDTLMLSALLFPQKRFHALLKKRRLQGEVFSNPLEDALSAEALLQEEIRAFMELSQDVRDVLYLLLAKIRGFAGFFTYLQAKKGAHFATPGTVNLTTLVRRTFEGKLCGNAAFCAYVASAPEALAYALAFIWARSEADVAPLWVRKRYPVFDEILTVLAGMPCREGCAWCREHLSAVAGLRRVFGFEAFRAYDGEPLQERAVEAALRGESLLALFPTGGGKSITFQLPAILQGEATRGLTLVISPLLSLMKDQVDNLARKGLDVARTVNSMLSPLERKDALEAVRDGRRTSILYVSPELLRSLSLRQALSERRIERVVIDEAHCFSAWGHDFRVDYLHIGTFLKEFEAETGRRIPVSCFTATAQPKVVQDIVDYFRVRCGIELKLFSAGVARKNLRYRVEHVENDGERYQRLRTLLDATNGPTIVYVTYARTAEDLAEKLQRDGFAATCYHGKLPSEHKIEQQNAFIEDRARIMVATNAFGMGVDKADVRLVVHYEISSSLENYVQEAGRAGRDPSLNADCVILFNEADLDKHFQLLSTSKLALAEIQSLWKAIKDLTKVRPFVTASPIELAREAGWKLGNDAYSELETRVKTAVSLLEETGYVRRGKNVPRIYATSIRPRTFMEGQAALRRHFKEGDPSLQTCERILRSLIAERSRKDAQDETPESRVDVLADRLGLTRAQVVDAVSTMRELDILKDENDMGAVMKTPRVAADTLRRHSDLERRLYEVLPKLTAHDEAVGLKTLNAEAMEGDTKGTKPILTVLRHLAATKQLRVRRIDAQTQLFQIEPQRPWEELGARLRRRTDVAQSILEILFESQESRKGGSGNNGTSTHVSDAFDLSGGLFGESLALPADSAARTSSAPPGNSTQADKSARTEPASFSTVGLLKRLRAESLTLGDLSVREIEGALLYLHRIGALALEGGFMVIYNALSIERLVLDNRRQFRKEDFRALDEHYAQKVRQIHIVGEYANLMTRDLAGALRYVADYFSLEPKAFMKRWFAGRDDEVARHMTNARAKRILGNLSPAQAAILESPAQHIVVAAGPGSGKTRVLVHKLAHLLLEEDVKASALLMLTFSRSAALEFKRRLIALYGPGARAVEIKTFHAFAFDLLGRPGSLTESGQVVRAAVDAIDAGEVDPERLAKSVLVLDEAQDMSETEFALVERLMAKNDLRVIAVGDDDQNIYAFRQSSSEFMMKLISTYDAERYELLENYRSVSAIVETAEAFVAQLPGRLKTRPSRSVRRATGLVRMRVVPKGSLERAALQDVLDTRRTEAKDSMAVLAPTNEMAEAVCGLLLDAGVDAALIQSVKNLRFTALHEVDWLIDSLTVERQKDKDAGPLITPGLWRELRERFDRTFAKSAWRPNVNRILDDFESVTDAAERYASDLTNFLSETTLDETFAPAARRVTVSTYHRAKGAEFDRVVLVVPTLPTTPEDMRAFYVAATRAKNELHFVARSPLLRQRFAESAPIEVTEDTTVYPPATRLRLTLGYADVFLGNFVERRRWIARNVRAGDALTPVTKPDSSVSLRHESGFEFRFSNAFSSGLWRQKLARGFVLREAAVHAVVRWHDRDRKVDELVLLPRLTFEKPTCHST